VWEVDLREVGSKYGVTAPLIEKDLCTKIMIAAGSDMIWI
jgi:hypothetical protein